MDDLIAWLRGVLDEDERLAKMAAEEARPPWRFEVWGGDAFPYLYVLDANDEAVVDVGTEGIARHVAAHNPAAVLADIAAKRKILGDENDGAAVFAVHERGICWPQELTDWADDVIRLLASAYADRPGYRAEWSAT
jgi:hypothetical protein